MIFFQTALYFEAVPAIERYGLSCVYRKGGLSVFAEKKTGTDGPDDLRGAAAVAVTGTGSYAAAAGVSFALGMLRAGEGDIFVNYGAAGASRESGLKVGKTVRCIKVVREGERAVYPDVLLGSGFRNAAAFCVNGAAAQFVKCDGELPVVFDNESYGALFAAMRVLGPEACFSLKTVTDFAAETAAKGGKIDPKTTTELLRTSSAGIFEAVEKWAAEISNASLKSRDSFTFDAETEAAIEALASSLGLTFSNREALKNTVRRDVLLGKDDTALLRSLVPAPEDVPADKQGRAKLFAEILGKLR